MVNPVNNNRENRSKLSTKVASPTPCSLMLAQRDSQGKVHSTLQSAILVARLEDTPTTYLT